uniref:Uncharacterized protein n=1 Tax=Guillardia theta TaxID=55529 RepID=A0A7S4KFP8_GUITH|mmetsp:Transcript_24211/g.78924  ORF Transcript_24211/g.78924 Transcript_24211/m.78924 type:complete len:373 (+) Transcript_24211:111-1229(+)
MKKSSTKTINKRSGFFYGSSDGHPIVWNNDWNSLIQKEVAARDEFSRKFMTGKIRPQPPVYADISMDNTNWNSLLRSTYSDLGRWGDETFRESVPHKVLKKEAELPSLPGTPERTDRLSEFAYKHARFQLGKHVNQDMLTSKVEKHKSKKKSHEGEEKSNEKGEGEEGKGELRDLLAACLSTDSRGIKKAAALAHKPSSSQRRAKSVEPSSTADKELWKTTSGELGSWGSMTQRKYWPARTSKTIVEAKKVDVNRPVYPSRNDPLPLPAPAKSLPSCLLLSPPPLSPVSPPLLLLAHLVDLFCSHSLPAAQGPRRVQGSGKATTRTSGTGVPIHLGSGSQLRLGRRRWKGTSPGVSRSSCLLRLLLLSPSRH